MSLKGYLSCYMCRQNIAASPARDDWPTSVGGEFTKTWKFAFAKLQLLPFERYVRYLERHWERFFVWSVVLWRQITDKKEYMPKRLKALVRYWLCDSEVAKLGSGKKTRHSNPPRGSNLQPWENIGALMLSSIELRRPRQTFEIALYIWLYTVETWDNNQ